MEAKDGDFAASKIVEEMEKLEEEDNKRDVDDSRSFFLFVTLFYLLGTACYVPHNFYVTANEYWMYKFRDPNFAFNVSTTGNKTDLQKNFTSSLSICNNVGMIIFFFLTILIQRRLSYQIRIIGSLSMFLVLFGITLAFTYIDTDSYQGVFFIVSLCIGGLLASISVILMVSLYQMAMKFPPRCLAAELAGQALCGILAAVVQIISLAIVPSATSTAALYFIIAMVTIFAVMVFYIVVLQKSESFNSRFKKKRDNDKKAKKEQPKLKFATLKNIFVRLWMIIVALVLNVANSGMLHPGLTALVESSGKGTNVWSDVYFLPVCVFFLYNTIDFIGRESSNHIPIINNKYIILTTSVVRLVFFPLILLCNLQPRKHLPVVFYNDAFFIVFFLLFSLSGGYLGNVVILAMAKYGKPEDMAIGALMIVLIIIIVSPVFSICGGILVNSY